MLVGAEFGGRELQKEGPDKFCKNMALATLCTFILLILLLFNRFIHVQSHV